MHPSPDVVFRALDEGAVLVHMDTSQIYELNATAAHVWTLVASGVPAESLAAALVETFAIDRTSASREVDTLLAQLLREGLLCQ